MINAALTPNPDNKAHAVIFAGKADYATKMRYKHAKFSVILNLCLIAGALLFVRCVLALNGYFNTLDMSQDAAISALKPMQAPKVEPQRPFHLACFVTRQLQLLTSTEWLRGDRLCTWKGATPPALPPLACRRRRQATITSRGPCPCQILPTTSWALAYTGAFESPSCFCFQRPLTSPASFVMFAPFLAFIDKFNRGAALMVLQATFLYALGPGMAAFITPNLHEQASIWCLFSMAQVLPPSCNCRALAFFQLLLPYLTIPRPLPSPPQIFIMIFVVYGSFNKDKIAANKETTPRSPAKSSVADKEATPRKNSGKASSKEH